MWGGSIEDGQSLVLATNCLDFSQRFLSMSMLFSVFVISSTVAWPQKLYSPLFIMRWGSISETPAQIPGVFHTTLATQAKQEDGTRSQIKLLVFFFFFFFFFCWFIMNFMYYNVVHDIFCWFIMNFQIKNHKFKPGRTVSFLLIFSLRKSSSSFLDYMSTTVQAFLF